MNATPRTKLILKLENKKYRDAYVSAHVRNGMSYQIRALREQRGWTQDKLGEEAGKPQHVIARLEDPSYGKANIPTLLEIASAFDVALLIKFVPYRRLLDEVEDLSPAALSAESFTKELPILRQGISDKAEERKAPASQSQQEAVGLPTVVGQHFSQTIPKSPLQEKGRLGDLSQMLGPIQGRPQSQTRVIM